MEEKDKQLKTRERTIKAKETAINKLEDVDQELKEQLQAAQVLTSKLELKVNTLTDEVRTLKLCATVDTQNQEHTTPKAPQPATTTPWCLPTNLPPNYGMLFPPPPMWYPQHHASNYGCATCPGTVRCPQEQKLSADKHIIDVVVNTIAALASLSKER